VNGVRYFFNGQMPVSLVPLCCVVTARRRVVCLQRLLGYLFHVYLVFPIAHKLPPLPSLVDFMLLLGIQNEPMLAKRNPQTTHWRLFG
jgi:hypothetical protein